MLRRELLDGRYKVIREGCDRLGVRDRRRVEVRLITVSFLENCVSERANCVFDSVVYSSPMKRSMNESYMMKCRCFGDSRASSRTKDELKIVS